MKKNFDLPNRYIEHIDKLDFLITGLHLNLVFNEFGSKFKNYY